MKYPFVFLLSMGFALLPAPGPRAEDEVPTDRGAAAVPALTEPESPVPPATEAVDPQLKEAAGALERGEWRKARAKTELFLKRNKKSPEGWVLWGRTYLPNHRYGKAIRRCRKAVKVDPFHAPGYYWAGKAYEAWGKRDEAANEYQAAFHADPSFEAAKAAWQRLKGAGAPEE